MKIKSKLVFLLSLTLSLVPVQASFAEVEAVEEAGVVPSLSTAGTIVSINVEQQHIVLQYPAANQEQPAETLALYLSDATQVIRDGSAIVLADVKEGDNVSAAYHVDESGSNVVDVLVLE